MAAASVPMSSTTFPCPVPERESIWTDYVRRIAQGDSEALGALYDESSALLHSLALRILGDRRDAEEVTLDVYTNVWRSAREFDGSRGSVRSWLVMMTRSRAIDRWRSAAARGRVEQTVESVPEIPQRGASPEAVTAQGQERTRVKKAMASLPREQREAIELAYYSGLSQAEMAVRLGVPLGTVKTRVRLAMGKLRELLATGSEE